MTVGLTALMVDSELLASGSVNGFISGKHFNGCKRFYPIIYLTLQMLHFKIFLIDNKLTINVEIRIMLNTFMIQKVSSRTFKLKEYQTFFFK